MPYSNTRYNIISKVTVYMTHFGGKIVTGGSRENTSGIVIGLVIIFAGLPVTITAIYIVLCLSDVRARIGRSDDNG